METMIERRSAATRTMLTDYVGDHPAHKRSRVWGVGLILVGALAGASVSTAAFAATSLLTPGPAFPTGQPTPDLPASIPAPAGVTPGSPMIVALGDPVTVAFDGATTVALTSRPVSATHLRVTVSPAVTSDDDSAASGGRFTYGTDAGGNNPSGSWTASDIAGGTAGGWYDFPLDDSVTTLYLSSDGAHAVATLQYLTHVPTDLGVNANGDTYGVTGSSHGEPDLIAVVATNGQYGYVYRSELEDADGTAAARGFSSPGDALAWQQTGAGATHVIPVYEADGTTKIGEFQVGG